jgi:hypothetical protein
MIAVNGTNACDGRSEIATGAAWNQSCPEAVPQRVSLSRKQFRNFSDSSAKKCQKVRKVRFGAVRCCFRFSIFDFRFLPRSTWLVRLPDWPSAVFHFPCQTLDFGNSPRFKWSDVRLPSKKKFYYTVLPCVTLEHPTGTQTSSHCTKAEYFSWKKIKRYSLVLFGTQKYSPVLQ